MATNDSRLLRTAWLVVALLWPVALLNYLDRQMLAAMKGSVTGDITSIAQPIDWGQWWPWLHELIASWRGGSPPTDSAAPNATEGNWGLLLASFKWVYAFLSPLGGYIADRFSKRGIIIGSLVVWSAVTWATGHCETYEQLLWTRALMGVSEAFYIPAALALIADFHAGATRSRAVGIHQMAIYCGIVIGGMSGYAADDPDLGWRWAFSAAGLAGLLYALPLAWALPRPPQREVSAAAGPGPLEAARSLLCNLNFVLLVLCFTLPALAGWVVKDWMPAILREQIRQPDGTPITQGEAGMTATLWTSLASVAGACLGGWWADHWMRSNLRGRTFVSALGMSLLIPALFAISHADSVLMAAAILTVFGLGWGFFDCNNMPILCQIVRPELRATGYGIMNLVSISCGGLADWGFGLLRDSGVPLPLIFGVFAAVALLSVRLMLMIRPRADLIAADPAGS